MEKIGISLPAETLAAYKVRVGERIKEGFEFADVPCELLYALIERAEAWTRHHPGDKVLRQEEIAHERQQEEARA